MKTCIIGHQGTSFHVDFSAPIDISIPIHPNGARAWYVKPMRFEPVRTDQFIGSIAEGGAVNFRDVWFNPHGHGTHTECFGHIDQKVHSVNQKLREHIFVAQLITVAPEVYHGTEWPYLKEGDKVIGAHVLSGLIHTGVEALVVRTVPNDIQKLSRDYSATNPAFFHHEFTREIRKMGIRHLLTDLPSVDREEDGGVLMAHKAFWRSGFPGDESCTITEMIFVDNKVHDGLFLLQLGIAPFENDASPSKPILYRMKRQ